ncbi:nitrilase [Vibrio natriegens]|uniref:carbon-nitrogen hydrolase family protein n=1 Tax=Vibrio natriegens TaxID=691 RepID=UPI0008041506|nr:carbon-nitrogen hydrolase family protein [Vibrio natriegens]ANQ23922.1 nitrilase [Vibrio natriegens]
MKKLAVVQRASGFLDKQQSIALAVESIQSAANNGAELVVFTEAFIPGYPVWLWRLRPGKDWGTTDSLYQRLMSNAVDLSSSDLDPIYEAAKRHHVTVVCGINERDSSVSRTTLYNTYITVCYEGNLINVHRKLMPTNPERMVWGFGDATGLRVVDTPVGRIGALVCWENYMPLARYALYAQGVEIYIAPTYDSGSDWTESLRHIAREGRCYVVGSGNLLRVNDLPDDFPEKETLYPDKDEWINGGDSTVIAPGGETLVAPLHEEEGILYCDIDTDKVAAARRSFDVAGHYSRPDIFTLNVNRAPQTSLRIREAE